MRESCWIPFARVQALRAGDPPQRVKLLGKKYVSYRSKDDRIGFFDEGCPHRGASLALARTEGCALRCIFHGWKIDVTGEILEIPTEGERSAKIASHIKMNRYPTIEAGGLIWVFLGKNEPPELPRLPFMEVPPENVWLTRTLVPCNWLQGLEAALDSSHVSFLHKSWLTSGDGSEGEKLSVPPLYRTVDTSYGMRAEAVRPLTGGTSFLRTSEFIMPFATLVPGGLTEVGREGGIFISVPVDNTTHLLFWGLWNDSQAMGDRGAFFALEPLTDLDNYATFEGDESNNWGQDRGAMAQGHYSGFTKRLLQEDVVVQMSMGEIADRTQENIISTDLAVVRCRQRLLKLLDSFEGGGDIRGVLSSYDPQTYPVGKVIEAEADLVS
jgi:phthalate 4,5-dioxygenase oxygenase subunit